jgi:hypothetical protein
MIRPVEQEHADAAERDRYVFIERPRCPLCSSLRLKTDRTERHGDESVTRHTHCRDCGAKFFVVVE